METKGKLKGYHFEFDPKYIETMTTLKGVTGVAYNEYEVWITTFSNPDDDRAVYERII